VFRFQAKTKIMLQFGVAWETSIKVSISETERYSRRLNPNGEV
jgi:hypothetical protein